MNIEELIDEYNFSTIIYKDLTKYNLNKAELNFIENYYKDKYNEIISNRKARFSDCNLTRDKDELVSIAENEEFKEFEKLNKYLN